MAKNRIILSTTVNEVRVALVLRGELREFFVERADIDRIVGNIYKGRVVSVHSGLQAAFVDIGVEKAAFLPLSSLREDNDLEVDGEDKPSTERLQVETGNEILVQVIKDPLGTKGARVTRNISIPGKFVVLTPTSNRVAVSRKIPERKERERVIRIVRKNKPKDKGFIIRTAAEGKEAADFKADIKNLLRIWSRIEKSAMKKMKKNVPALIHKDVGLVIRLMRDLFTEKIDEVVVDSKDAFKEVLGYVNLVTPGMANRVKLYHMKTPIFRTFRIQQEIDRIMDRTIRLKSGGYIIIEPTEALISIDVNSGKSSIDTVPEELALTTNLEAAVEIAKHLRLRDIGGIIVVDFIDMEKEESNDVVVSVFKKAMKGDRARYKIYDISSLGLMEMTRKRVTTGISRSFFEICPVCKGKGYVLSRIHLSLRVIRGLESNAKILENKDIIIYGSAEFVEYFSKEFADTLARFTKMYRIGIRISEDKTLPVASIKIYDSEKLKDITNAILM